MNTTPLTEPVNGIIFDCDGVIIDSRAANCHFYNSILKAFGLPPMTAEQEAYTHMATVHQSLATIVPAHLQPELPRVCSETVNYQRDIMPLIELEAGLFDFVRWLNARGIRCAVHTNRSSGMPFVLEKFQLTPYFDPVVTAAMVPPKPAPDGVYYVEKAWNMPREHMLFIGDSSMDAQTARNAGVRFVSFMNSELAADMAIDAFSQLQTFLQGESPS